MQPCSREMQAIAASLSAIGIQPLLGGVSGGDEFLEQMLAAAPSAAWCDHMAEDPPPPPPPPTRYTPYDPIGGGAASAPASSAEELGLLAPAIGDGGGEIDPSSPFKSLNPSVGDRIYPGGFSGFLPLSATQQPRASMSFGIAPTNASATATTTTTAPKQRVRARRGQATDPHSIAERLRRERIAERMKALQELVPNANKTDKASMLDEIIDYVKFLQLQVKVLSVSRLGGAAAAAPLVGDLSSQGGSGAGGGGDGKESETGREEEKKVAKMMEEEEDMGRAMQYLQGKGLCLMPISLASAISSSSSPSHHSLRSSRG